VAWETPATKRKSNVVINWGMGRTTKGEKGRPNKGGLMGALFHKSSKSSTDRQKEDLKIKLLVDKDELA